MEAFLVFMNDCRYVLLTAIKWGASRNRSNTFCLSPLGCGALLPSAQIPHTLPLHRPGRERLPQPRTAQPLSPERKPAVLRGISE